MKDDELEMHTFVFINVRQRIVPLAIRSLILVLLCAVTQDAETQDAVTQGAETQDAEIEASEKGAIYFGNKYYLGGHFDSVPDQSPGICWKCESFDAPFVFDPAAITEISFHQRLHDSGDAGLTGFELKNGDVIFGQAITVEDGSITVESPLLGTATFDVRLLTRIFRWSDGKDQIFSGPGELTDWTLKDRSAWRGEGGQISTSTALMTAYRDIGLTRRCRVELEVSWEKSPNFVICLGTDGTGESTKQAFRIEVWGSTLVLVRELGRVAKVASLGTIDKSEEKLRISVELDQERSVASVYSERGDHLGTINLEMTEGKVCPGIAVENIRGAFKINALRVLEGSVDSGSDLTHNIDELTVEGNVLVLRKNQDDTPVVVSELSAIRFAALPANEAPLDEATQVDATQDDATDIEPESHSGEVVSEGPQFRLVTHGSTRLTGVLQKVLDNKAVLLTEYLSSPVSIAVKEIRSLRAEKRSQMQPESNGRKGTLQLEDTNMLGELVDTQSTESSSCLRFHPVFSSNAANLLAKTSGKLVYRDPQPEKATAAVPQVQVRRAQRGFLGAVVGAIAGKNDKDEDSGIKKYIHLRSGDAVEAKVLKISEDGVLIDSLITGEKWIPHESIKAAVIRGSEAIPEMEAGKRARLLSVPRMRKQHPPKHLLISMDGDFLKGNLIELNEERAIVENRLDTVEIARRHISKIIWFHDDEIATSEEDATVEQQSVNEDSPETAEFIVQAVQPNGTRLTFACEQVGGGEVIGTSPVLGACIVHVRTIDQLLFGEAIDLSNSSLPFHEWKLSHAPEPRVLQEGGSGTANSGTSSSLVGNPAPEIRLEALDGSTFRLSEQRGSVVVLDFWASWCGPCMQAMPVIHDTVRDFDPADVKLFAVNLQEDREQIEAALKRLGLVTSVVMDIDGVAAARYEATAIPQTVVIDREGIVRRVFVGGGGSLGESLAAGIKSALEMKPESAVESE